MYSPKTKTEWIERVEDAIITLREARHPCPMELLRKTDDGMSLFSIEGALTLVAMDNEAIPYRWVEEPHYDDDDDPDCEQNGIRWRIAREDEPDESATQCVPDEALRYFGLPVADVGGLLVPRYMLPVEILAPMLVHQCEDMNPLPIALVNDMLYETREHPGLTFNPLRVWAGLMEMHLKEATNIFWDPEVKNLKD